MKEKKRLSQNIYFFFTRKFAYLKKNSLEENKKTFGLYILAFKYYFRKY